MSGKKPSELEKMRAVRYMRHRENCRECNEYGRNPCLTALRQHGLWGEVYDKEVYEPAEKRREARWGLPRS